MEEVRVGGSAALAAGTEMRAPASETGEADPTSAAPAEFPLPSINLKAILKQPLESKAVPEVTHGRALESHRLIEDSGNSSVESLQAFGSQA
jgi:hypothetical protein